MDMMAEEEWRSGLGPFLAGALAGAASAVLVQSLWPRRGIDPRLIPDSPRDPDIPPTVVVPGLLGSELVRPDGTEVWLNLGNAFGTHDLSLPLRVPLSESRDDLQPAGLLGVDAVLPRLFGFTEYADLLALLESGGFRRDRPVEQGAAYHVFTYDWRRDLVESARRLGESLDALAEAFGLPDVRFNLVGHSMGGLVARYYLRYGGAEPGGPVTWAGARRIRNLVLVAVPSAGSIWSLDAILHGSRVGLSSTTLAASVVSHLPSIYQLLPPPGAPAFADASGEPRVEDVLDVATWERFGWGPFAPRHRREDNAYTSAAEDARNQEFLAALLDRSRRFHESLARPPSTRCPSRVVALGGDCLPTLARAVVGGVGFPPRFQPSSAREAERMFEAGDGRVTRSSVLAGHLPGAEESETGSGIPEMSAAFFGSADHHGIYDEPTFQSVILRLLLRPARRASAAVSR